MATTLSVTNSTANAHRIELIGIGSTSQSSGSSTNPTMDVTQQGLSVCLGVSDTISCDGAPSEVVVRVLAAPTDFDLQINGAAYTTSKTLGELILQTNSDENCLVSVSPATEFDTQSQFTSFRVPKDSFNKCMLCLRYRSLAAFGFDGVYTFSGMVAGMPHIATPQELFRRINEWLANNRIPVALKITSIARDENDNSYLVDVALRYRSSTVGSILIEPVYSECINISTADMYLLNGGMYNGPGCISSDPTLYSATLSPYMVNVPSGAVGGWEPIPTVNLTPFDTINGPLIQQVNLPAPFSSGFTASSNEITVQDAAFDARPTPTGALLASAIKLVPPDTNAGYLVMASGLPNIIGPRDIWSGPALWTFTDDITATEAFNAINPFATFFPNSKNTALVFSGVDGDPQPSLTIIPTRYDMSVEDVVYYFRWISAAMASAWVTRSLTDPEITLTLTPEITSIFGSSAFFSVNIPSGMQVMSVSPGGSGHSWTRIYNTFESLMCDVPDFEFDQSLNLADPRDVQVTPGQTVYIVIHTNGPGGSNRLTLTGQ